MAVLFSYGLALHMHNRHFLRTAGFIGLQDRQALCTGSPA
jgi:hypothetical protein